VDRLASLGVAGATVLLGVDGTRWGARQRARFLARNAQVPMMVIAVGDGDRIADAAGAVTALLAEPLVTLERVAIGAPAEGARDGSWLKLMAYSSDRDRHRALVAELRRAGAPGATTVRGTWGYHAAAAPHGDHLAQWHRRVPLVTTVLDRPGPAAARSFAVVRRVMGDDALVTCEIVPVGAAPA
jgi:PII-like signaling protein